MRPRLLHLGYARGRASDPMRRACFNEAEAFTPRIQGIGDDDLAGYGCASMRPRLLHLGYSLHLIPFGPEGAVLQ